MNGCHSTLHPNRLQHDLVWHSKGNVSWPNVFTKECQYIKQENLVDANCNGCKEKNKQNEQVHST
jgi:hypothetical protein